MVRDLQLWRQRLSWPFRRKIKSRVLIKRRVVLDWLILDDVLLDQCEIVYYGLGPICMKGSNMVECTYSVAGPAGNTLQWISVMFGTNLDLFKLTFPHLIKKLEQEYEEKKKVQD